MRGAILLNRIEPVAGPEHYKSYSVRAPVKTHWRSATCEEYECDAFLRGFITTVALTSDLGQKQYHYLTHDKTRAYSMQRVGADIVKFIYGPGNRCFKSDDHRVPIGKPPRLLVVGGDWRGNPRKEFIVHSRVDDWVDDCREHQEKMATILRRG